MEKSKRCTLDRRRFLGVSGAALAGVSLGLVNVVSAEDVSEGEDSYREGRDGKARRVLRLAHFSDIHVQPELGADKGLIACLHHAQQIKDPPELIITGGDTIMDSFEQDAARTTLLWDLYHQVVKAECSLPIRACIGNHDIWGWNKTKSRTTGQEPNWGKQRALDELGLTQRYYSFDQAGWHMVILDGTHTDPNDEKGYIAKLDEKQFAWLKADLQATPATTPILVVSHEPIVSAAPFFGGARQIEGDWRIPISWVHMDAHRIMDLFKKHPNVKLCLSGHLHRNDRVDYCGVTYICGGAVCGDWWKGDHYECDEGYGIVDLYADGSFAHQYVAFGWEPRQ